MTAPPAASIFRFSHQAMRTEWTFLLVATDESIARSAADAICRDIDQIENELSRFKAYSDVTRLSRLTAGESISVSAATWDCLSLARDVWEETGGAFDVAIGNLYELWRQRPAAEMPDESELARARARSGSHLFELIPDQWTVRLLADEVKFDLGAIGKGYALDMAAALLRDEWDITRALLVTGGGSTILALGRDPDGAPWMINAGPPGAEPLAVTDAAVSASGFSWQGAHIINPRTGRPLSTATQRAWALAPTAALSDALSTAFLVMGPAETRPFCLERPGISAIFEV